MKCYEEWKADPARPAIIVGTIDMIGSKLLFSGYGDGRYGRAHHAGLIGQDALIIHDEAHLTPAFSPSGDGFNASARNLGKLIGDLDEDEKLKAFSPKPPVPPLTHILLDAWSLSSITAPMPGRPEVAPYLHGLTNDPPQTYVAWRREVTLLKEGGR